MAKPMTYQQTLSQMALWHVQVKEHPGWRTRGRDPEHGPFSNVRGIVIHHTGSDEGQSDDYLNFLAIRGRLDLPSPLCNVSTDMDGDLWLIAQGRANHAGVGSLTTFNRVAAEDYPGYTSELRPGPDSIDGNAVYYGNEVRYDGGQPMTPKQYASATHWAAAICHFHGWSALSIIGHREHTGRKNDPGHCPMNKFRADVAALLKAGPPSAGGTPTHPPKENDVQLTDTVGPDRSDPKGGDLTLGEASNRGGYAYWNTMEGGPLFELVQSLKTENDDLKRRLAALEQKG